MDAQWIWFGLDGTGIHVARDFNPVIGAFVQASPLRSLAEGVQVRSSWSANVVARRWR